jgi:hypothetical protein
VLEVCGILDGWSRDPNDLASYGDKLQSLLNAALGIHRVACEHGLDADGMRAPDADVACVYVSGNPARD